MKTKSFLFLSLCIVMLVSSCKKNDNGNPSFPLKTAGKFTATDYAVYSACLAASFPTLTDVIIRQYTVTTNPSELQSRFSNGLVAEFPDFSPALFPDYIAKNDTMDFLGAEITATGKQIRLVAEEELKFYSASLNSQEFWNAFNPAYPNAVGYLAFSRIGYNADATQAILEVGHSWSVSGGQGLLVYMKFNGTDWVVLKTVVSWVA